MLTEGVLSTAPSSLLGYEVTTRCSYTSTLPKLSSTDSEWQAGAMKPATFYSDHFMIYTDVVVFEIHETLTGGANTSETTMTMDMKRQGESGSNFVTGACESPSPAAATTALTGEAAQTGSGSGTQGVQATSTQAAEACEVAGWVRAIVVVAAEAAAMIV